LISLISVECPGSVVREISELATWFEQVYDSNPQGMREAWHDTVTAMEMHSTGVTQLEVMESYKVVLPSSLTTRSLDKPVTFCSNNSRPVTFLGLPKGRCGELLGSLLKCIYDNFRACLRPENYLARADSNAKKSETTEILVALVGASNLRQSLHHFAATNMNFDDITQPGWQATTENVENLASIVEQKRESMTAFVFDIFGNGSVRFEQFDGTYSLPFKSHGTYHLGGKVVTTPPTTFKKLVENVLPVLKAKGDKPCIVIPPLPRYLFSRCCSDKGHCTNAADPEFPSEMLSGFIKQRNELIRLLVQNGLTDFKVMDTCCTTSCIQTANIQTRLGELAKVTSDDGVHYNAIGRKNLAERTVKCLISVLSNGKSQ
jgi:hypothetical protein